MANINAGPFTTRPEIDGTFGVVASTLSAALRRLEMLGYIANTPVADDRRRRNLTLTDRGAEAMAGTSVLDCERVKKLLATLSPRDRVAAVRGLGLLARAARTFRTKESS